MVEEKQALAVNGWLVLGILLVAGVVSIVAFLVSTSNDHTVGSIISVVVLGVTGLLGAGFS